ncbi:MAG TPA: STAS domain-containing protein [Acidimicrobiales bacterium]|nr:STAS domain-containing protein [Acidimicrobiales bacterium]
MADQFVLKTQWSSRVLGVDLAGELDVVWAPRLTECMEGVLAAPLAIDEAVVDLSALEFVDLIGLRSLAAACFRLRDVSGALEVRGAGKQVLRVIHLSRIHVPGLVVDGDRRREVRSCQARAERILGPLPRPVPKTSRR